jgi:hypothetical protein
VTVGTVGKVEKVRTTTMVRVSIAVSMVIFLVIAIIVVTGITLEVVEGGTKDLEAEVVDIDGQGVMVLA